MSPRSKGRHCLFPRQPTDYSNRLPKGWKDNMLSADQRWIGKALFASQKGTLTTQLTNWWHPPAPQTDLGKQPKVDLYFRRRLFLWMPRLVWAIDFRCPRCNKSLRSKGIYNRVRLVLDVEDCYYLACEYMDCGSCNGTFLAWDERMLNELTDGHRARFPVVLTRKYACDQSVISLMRSRTIGNSSSALKNSIEELHSQAWLRKVLIYTSDCERHRKGVLALMQRLPVYERPPAFKRLPTAAWFLADYVRDVYARINELKAAATSIYGTILKIDSTKKVTEKLQGLAASTASWATNIGNERGEIVLSILTSSEAAVSLKKMADGLMLRFEKAGQPPPAVLYTDRDCCSADGCSKYKDLFAKWPNLEVHPDIWHFMRRLAVAVTSESHPLYGVFMARLSAAIFEWDESDYSLLCRCV